MKDSNKAKIERRKTKDEINMREERRIIRRKAFQKLAILAKKDIGYI